MKHVSFVITICRVLRECRIFLLKGIGQMNENEWRQLVKNALNNDEAAFDRLYKETERPVYFLCLKLLGNEQDAKDAAQETYLAAFNGLSTLDDGANFPKWINGIAVNQCKRFLRTPKNESLDEKLEHGVEFSDDENFIPEDYVANAEKRRVIMNIIDTELSEVQRQTIILYYYNGLKTHEIASIMNCPEGTVTYRLSAARAKIKEAVLIYEKENKDRLHAIVPIPILTLILRSEAERTVVPDIRLFNNPAASANHLKAGGKTMLNTLKAKIIAGACAAAVVGGGVAAGVLISDNSKNKTESRPAVSASANVSKPTNVSKPANNSKPADSSAAESTADAEIAEWFDKPFAIPAGWEDELVHTSRLWSGQMSTDTPIYYMTIADVVYMSESPLTVQDVPEIFAGDIQKVVMKKFDCYNSKYRIAATDTQEITVQGYPFLKETGTIHTEEEEISAELSYIAYYGLMDFPTYEQMSKPAVWMVFAEGNDPAVLADMQKILDDTAANIN